MTDGNQSLEFEKANETRSYFIKEIKKKKKNWWKISIKMFVGFSIILNTYLF